MALTRQQKEAVVAEVAEAASGAFSAVAAEFRGLSVSQLNSLRVEARQKGVYLRVVKNTLTRRALAGTDFECLSEALSGPMIIGISQEDPGSAARLFRDFAKSNDALVPQAAAVGGQLYGPSELDKVASLPTRDEALAMLMSVMQAPTAKLVRTLNEVPGKLVRTVEAVRLQKEAA